MSQERYFKPIAREMFEKSSLVVRAFGKLNEASSSSDFARLMRFQIESVIDDYQFLLNKTNTSVTQVH